MARVGLHGKKLNSLNAKAKQGTDQQGDGRAQHRLAKARQGGAEHGNARKCIAMEWQGKAMAEQSTD